jgi:hypothetical protein
MAQATYSDALGTMLNANPVVLNSSGRANVFVTSLAYKFVLTTANGVTVWTIDNVTSSALALLATNNVWSGTQEFQNTVTFDSTPVFNTGFTAGGPVNLTLGGSLAGTFSGSPTFSGTPNFAGGLSVSSLTLSGQLTSTVTTGTAPFVVSSTTEVANLNAAMLEGDTWEAPGTIGSTTPSTAVFTTSSCTTSCTIDGVTISGTPSAGQVLTASSSSVAGWAAGPAVPVQAFYSATLSGTVNVSATTPTTVLTQAVTMPSAGCPCRAMISYGFQMTNSSQGTATSWISDGAVEYAAADWGINAANLLHNGLQTMDISPVTYANSAAVTFTLTVESSVANVVQVGHNFGSAPSYLHVSIIPSN